MLTGRLGHISRRTFASLGIANYRLFFGGVIVSTTGTWIQLIAENWLTLKLGGSGLQLGITSALQLGPIVLLGSYAGVMVDRLNRRRLVMLSQLLSGSVAAMLGLLALIGVARIWMVWVAALLVGSVETFNGPARQALSVELVGPKLISNAVSLTTAVTVSARAVGPAIGGLLVASMGVAPCFLINAASYGVGALSVLAMNTRRLKVEPPMPRARGQIVAGLRHARQHPALRGVLVMVAIVGIFGSNFQLLLALLATANGQGAALYGVMMSCMGTGMVVGSLLSAGWHSPTPRGVGLLAVVMGGSYLLTALAPGLTLMLLAVTVLGVAAGMFLAAASGTLQLNAGQGMRGRIMALYTIAALGTSAVGSPLIGWIAATWHIQVGLILCGASCLTACLVGRLVARSTLSVRQAVDSAREERQSPDAAPSLPID